MRAHDRKPVIAWLKRYDKAALGIPEPLRSSLRSEIDEHLEDTLLADATDEDVAVVLEELGDPKALVAAEIARAAEVHVDPRPRLRRRTLAIAAVVIIVVALFLAVGLPLSQALGR